MSEREAFNEWWFRWTGKKVGCENYDVFGAWQAQQTKVDETRKEKSIQEMEINHLAHANQAWQLKCQEQQKRIDKALQNLNLAFDRHKDWAIAEAVRVLRGGND